MGDVTQLLQDARGGDPRPWRSCSRRSTRSCARSRGPGWRATTRRTRCSTRRAGARELPASSSAAELQAGGPQALFRVCGEGDAHHRRRLPRAAPGRTARRRRRARHARRARHCSPGRRRRGDRRRRRAARARGARREAGPGRRDALLRRQHRRRNRRGDRTRRAHRAPRLGQGARVPARGTEP